MSNEHTPTMLNQVHSQKQSFTVLPQQIQLLKLFHLNTLGLQQRIQEELIENPVLEESVSEEDNVTEASKDDTIQEYQDQAEYQEDDIPDYKLEHNNYLSDADLPQRPIPEYLDFRKDLKEQVRVLLADPMQLMIAEYLIDSLSDDGMLEQDMSSIADDISFQKNKVIAAAEIEYVRRQLLRLEPMGIGCTSIKEFLLLQLRQRDQADKKTQLAIQLLEKNFGDLAHRNMEKIASQLNINESELRGILKLISTCQLKPLAESSGPPQRDAIVLDFVVTQNNDIIEVSLYRQRSSTLFINNSLSAMVTNGKCGDKGTLQYLKSKLSSAQWFVSAIKQRETTMLNVMKAIVRFQKDYFKDGDIRLLKPMILKDIADEVGVDISTASRITCNKYADTHFGTTLLKDLFSKGIENERGEAISNRVIQKAIEDVVEGENKQKPYTDQQLVAVLAEKGFNIARRTVAKYREQRQIPVMQVRALWA
jgi:RNA polymerase sigma-54 factor